MKKSLPALVAMLACVAAWAAAQTDYRKSRGYQAYEKANALFAAGKFQPSFALLEEALRLDPKLVPALTLKAKLAMGANRFDVARQSLNEALAVEPASAYARFLSGFLHHMQNDMPLALAELEKARQLDPRDPRPTLYLGLTHESLGHVQETMKFYEETIRIENATGKPQADTLLTYSRFLLVLGRPEECEKLISRALTLKPGSRDAHYERARLMLSRGDSREAAVEAERALTLPPPGVADRQIRYLLVRAYGLIGDEQQAQKHAAALRQEDAVR